MYTIIDGVKGKGHSVGTYLTQEVRSPGWWGEGEIEFFIDGDKEFPTICGTGNEDYFCGSDNFEVKATKRYGINTPYAGMPQVIPDDLIYGPGQRLGLYRWHITDPIRFEEDLKVTIQALGWQKTAEGRSAYLQLEADISSAAYWYQTEPHAPFPKLRILDPIGFRSLTQPDIPAAGGANLLVAFPAHTDTGRKTTTHSEFTLKIEPKNFGVMLRCKLDYQFPNQRARVFIAGASGPQISDRKFEWQPAGVWYLAGANTCVHSRPEDELGETQHNVQTSNRRSAVTSGVGPRRRRFTKSSPRTSRAGWSGTKPPSGPCRDTLRTNSAAISRAGSSASHFARAAVGDLRAEAEALTLAAAGLSGRPAWRTAGSSCTEVAGIRCQHRCSRALKILTLGT